MRCWTGTTSTSRSPEGGCRCFHGVAPCAKAAGMGGQAGLQSLTFPSSPQLLLPDALLHMRLMHPPKMIVWCARSPDELAIFDKLDAEMHWPGMPPELGDESALPEWVRYTSADVSNACVVSMKKPSVTGGWRSCCCGTAPGCTCVETGSRGKLVLRKSTEEEWDA